MDRLRPPGTVAMASPAKAMLYDWPTRFDPGPPSSRGGGLRLGFGGGGPRGPSQAELDIERQKAENERIALLNQQKELEALLHIPPPPDPPPPPLPTYATTSDTVQAGRDAERQAARRRGLASTRVAGRGGILTQPLGSTGTAATRETLGA